MILLLFLASIALKPHKLYKKIWRENVELTLFDFENYHEMDYYLYILRGFRNLVMPSENVKNTPNLIG